MPAFLQMGTLCELLDVKMISTNDVWAVGSYLTGGIVILHWDGISWTQVTEQGGGGAFGVVGPNDIYAVGEEIAHWNGSNWTLVDSLSQYPEPALNGITQNKGYSHVTLIYFYTDLHQTVDLVDL